MMAFAVESLGIHIFRAKIGESNGASLTLFRKLVSLSFSLWSMLLISYLHIHAMQAIRLNKISLILAYIWIVTHVLRVDIGLVLRAFFALNQCCWFCNIWEQHRTVRKDNWTGLTALQLVQYGFLVSSNFLINQMDQRNHSSFNPLNIETLDNYKLERK